MTAADNRPPSIEGRYIVYINTLSCKGRKWANSVTSRWRGLQFPQDWNIAFPHEPHILFFFYHTYMFHIEQHGSNPLTSYSIQLHVFFNLIWTERPPSSGYFHFPPPTFWAFQFTVRLTGRGNFGTLQPATKIQFSVQVWQKIACGSVTDR